MQIVYLRSNSKYSYWVLIIYAELINIAQLSPTISLVYLNHGTM